MHAIPTRYRGVTFRSRLEARWAIMFDLLGLGWEYEPIDLAGYIPDFLVDTQVWSQPQTSGPMLVEVRPLLHVEDGREVAREIIGAGWSGAALVAGAVMHSTAFGESVIGLGQPASLPADEWYRCGWHGEHRMFGYAGDDLVAVWREAGERSRWMPPT